MGREFVVVTSGGGEVFYMAHGPHANGFYNPPPFVTANPNHEHEDFRQEARRRTGLELSHAESSRYWFGEAWREIVSNPARAIRLSLAKLSALFNDFEVPDSHYYAVTSDLIPFLKVMPSFGWIVGLGILGLVLCIRAPKQYMLPIFFVLAYVVSILLTYNFGRFRLGMIPVWIILAAHGLNWLVGAWRQVPGRPCPTQLGRWSATVFVVLLTVVAFLPSVNYPQTTYAVERPVFHYILAMRNEDYPLAERNIRQAIQVGRGERKADAHHALGQLLQRTGRGDEARTEYLSAIELNPNESSAHFDLGVLLASAGEFDAAISHYKKAIQLNPTSAKAHYSAGVALAHQKKFSEAAELLTSATELDPNSSTMHNALALVLIEVGQIDEAVEHFRESLRLDPTSLEACYNCAVALQKSERIDEAEKQFRACLELDAAFAPAMLQLGMIANQKREFAEAVVRLQSALQLQQKLASNQTLEILASSYAGTGQLDKAIHTLEAALRVIDPSESSSPVAIRMRKALNQYRRAISSRNSR